MPRVSIEKDGEYFRVNVELEITTHHKLHSEKLNEENAKRLMKQLSHDFGGNLSC